MIDVNVDNQRVREFLEITLPLSGVLLGLIFAGITFWLETGFRSLEYSRELIREVFVSYAKIVFRLLIFIVLVSLFYIEDLRFLVTITFILFTFFFIKAVLDYLSKVGNVESIFSTKKLPNSYSSRRLYWRKVRNAGLKPWVRLGPGLYFIVVLPLYWYLRDSDWSVISNEAIFVSVLAAIVLVILELPSLITQSFDIQQTLMERYKGSAKEKAQTLSDLTEEEKWQTDKIEIQSAIAKKYLEELDIHPYIELELERIDWKGEGRPVLKNAARVNEYGVLHLNIMIAELEGNPARLREYIFEWTEKIMKSFKEWDSDIVQLALSFWWADEMTHLALFRASVKEIQDISELRGRAFVSKLKGKFLTELISEDLNPV